VLQKFPHKSEARTKLKAVYICNLEQDLIMDLQVFEGVQNFRYLGTTINSKKFNK
jgi:hypothetical protein